MHHKSEKPPALLIAEWGIDKARKLVPYSSNWEWENYADVFAKKTPPDYLRLLVRMVRADVKKRGSEDKAILDEIRRKIGIEFLSEDVLSNGIEKLFPLTIRSLGTTFDSIDNLYRYILKRYPIRRSKNKALSDLEFMETQAIRAIKNHIANCSEITALGLLLLMEYPDVASGDAPQLPKELIKLERVRYEKPGDHAFDVLYRTSGDIHDITTWNDDAVVYDGWAGVAYTIAQWKRWIKGKDQAPSYIIKTKYKLKLNDPFTQGITHAYVGQTHNRTHHIAIHSEKWLKKHKQSNKPFRPISLIALEMNNDLTKNRKTYQAAKNGDIDYFEKNASLLKSSSVHFTTVFELAIENGQFNIIKYLIKNQFIHIQEKDRLAFLKIAIENNQLHLFEYINDLYKPMHTLNQDDITILMLAAIRNGHLAAVEYFFNNYKAITEQCVQKEGHALLCAAAQHNKLDSLKYLLTTQTAINTDFNKNGSLLTAAANGHLVIVKYLIANGANPKSDKDSFGNSILHLAAANSQFDMLSYCLVNDMTNINLKNSFGETPLHFVAQTIRAKDILILQEILMKGASINVKNKKGETPLHLAIKKVNIDSVRLLIYLADITTRDNDKNTLLHAAVSNGNLEIVQLLLDRGADLNAVNGKNESPLLMAFNSYKLEIIDYLLQKTNRAVILPPLNHNDTIKYLRLAAHGGHLEIIKYLLERIVDINIRNDLSKQLIHLAAENGHFPLVEYFIEKKRNGLEKDNLCNTVLHIAVRNGNKRLVPLILDCIKQNTGDSNTASVLQNLINAKDYENETPLHFAAIKGELEIAEILIDQGAAINPKNIMNETPLHLAASKGKLEMVDKLLDKGATIDENAQYDQKTLSVLIDRIQKKSSLMDAIKISILKIAVKMGDLSIFSSLVSQPLPVNTQQPSLLSTFSIHSHVSEQNSFDQKVQDLMPSLLEMAKQYDRVTMQEYLQRFNENLNVIKLPNSQ